MMWKKIKTMKKQDRENRDQKEAYQFVRAAVGETAAATCTACAFGRPKIEVVDELAYPEQVLQDLMARGGEEETS